MLVRFLPPDDDRACDRSAAIPESPPPGIAADAFCALTSITEFHFVSTGSAALAQIGVIVKCPVKERALHWKPK